MSDGIRHISVRPTTTTGDSGSSGGVNSTPVDNTSVSNDFAELQNARRAMRTQTDEATRNTAVANNNVAESTTELNAANNSQEEHNVNVQNLGSEAANYTSEADRLRGEANILRALAQSRPAQKQIFLEQAARKEAEAIAAEQRAHQAEINQQDEQRRANSDGARIEDAAASVKTTTNQRDESAQNVSAARVEEGNVSSELGTAQAQLGTTSTASNANSNTVGGTSSATVGSTSSATVGSTSSATVGSTSSATVGGTSTSGTKTVGSASSSGTVGNTGLQGPALDSYLSSIGPGGGGGGIFAGAIGILQAIAQLNKAPISPHPTAQKAKWNTIQSLAERGMAIIEAIILDQTVTGTPLHQYAVLLKTIMATVMGEARGNSEFHGKEIEEYKKAEKDTHQHAQRA